MKKRMGNKAAKAHERLECAGDLLDDEASTMFRALAARFLCLSSVPSHRRFCVDNLQRLLARVLSHRRELCGFWLACFGWCTALIINHLYHRCKRMLTLILVGAALLEGLLRVEWPCAETIVSIIGR